jgi:hypothetical protein
MMIFHSYVSLPEGTFVARWRKCQLHGKRPDVWAIVPDILPWVPEASHPAWNDASRAMTSSGLKSSLLRGTVLVNHFQGPFRSGRFGFELSFGTHFHVCWLNHYFIGSENRGETWTNMCTNSFHSLIGKATIVYLFNSTLLMSNGPQQL